MTDNDIAATILADVQKLEERLSSTANVRSKLISKLETVVDQMTIDPATDKGSVLEAKMGIINTLLSTLDHHDTQQFKLISTRQKLKDAEVKEDSLREVSRTVAEYMRKLNETIAAGTEKIGTTSNTVAEDDSSLDKLVEEQGIILLEGETTINTCNAKDMKVEYPNEEITKRT